MFAPILSFLVSASAWIALHFGILTGLSETPAGFVPGVFVSALFVGAIFARESARVQRERATWERLTPQGRRTLAGLRRLSETERAVS